MKKTMKAVGIGVLIGIAVTVTGMEVFDRYTEEIHTAGRLAAALVIAVLVIGLMVIIFRDMLDVCSYCSHPPHRSKQCKVRKNDDTQPCSCTHSLS